MVWGGEGQEVRIIIRVGLKLANHVARMYTYLKKLMNEILYPFCSAIPAATTLADAPISVPLPTNRQTFQ